MDKIPITLMSDNKGYFDRECPNSNCLYVFKIHMKDWENKISDDEVHCPMCGHVDTSDKWWTQEQLDGMQEILSSYALNMIQNELDKSFKKLANSTKNNKHIQIKYKPGRKISFINNPIGQREEWATDITCEKCQTRYSVIGSAYFCPCCGYNSAVSVFNKSMESIKKMVNSLSEMKSMLIDIHDIDTAETMCRSLLEGSIGDIVSAFQKFASCLYDEITGKTSRVNDFQMVDKGSQLFMEATGKGYETWLTSNEIQDMKVLFQKRHLLEHNSGLVDQKYIDKSNDLTYSIGQRIVVKITDSERLIEIVNKLSTGLLTLK